MHVAPLAAPMATACAMKQGATINSATMNAEPLNFQRVHHAALASLRWRNRCAKPASMLVAVSELMGHTCMPCALCCHGLLACGGQRLKHRQ